MYRILAVVLILAFSSCKTENKKITAQEIVDKSIAVSGGDLYKKSTILFDFRGKHYIAKQDKQGKVLQRIFKDDSVQFKDVLSATGFKRFEDGRVVVLADSIAQNYSNAVNSVHYFAKLPYGLNDAAVNKVLLGETKIKNKKYYKVQVTFNEVGGGDDFDDTYLYWFDKDTYKVAYLAYDFHVNGGGVRFREAYNERYVGGIRFVDYYNYKPTNSATNLMQIDSAYMQNKLKLLSKIVLDSVNVIN